MTRKTIHSHHKLISVNGTNSFTVRLSKDVSVAIDLKTAKTFFKHFQDAKSFINNNPTQKKEASNTFDLEPFFNSDLPRPKGLDTTDYDPHIIKNHLLAFVGLPPNNQQLELDSTILMQLTDCLMTPSPLLQDSGLLKPSTFKQLFPDMLTNRKLDFDKLIPASKSSFFIRLFLESLLEKRGPKPISLINWGLHTKGIRILDLFGCDLEGTMTPDPFPTTITFVGLCDAKHVAPAFISALLKAGVPTIDLSLRDLTGVTVPDPFPATFESIELFGATNVPPELTSALSKAGLLIDSDNEA